MDNTSFDPSKIKIKVAQNENLYDLNLCASDFIDFIDNFETLFLNKKLFILTAYYKQILVGLVVAEDKTNKIDNIDKIIPIVFLHLIYVNPNYRNKKIARNLLTRFINIQKMKGMASIATKLPQNHVIGINFLQKNNFHQKERKGSKVFLELKLWNDLGIEDCQIIDEEGNDFFS